jgi:hypothetical protein
MEASTVEAGCGLPEDILHKVVADSCETPPDVYKREKKLVSTRILVGDIVLEILVFQGFFLHLRLDNITNGDQAF